MSLVHFIDSLMGSLLPPEEEFPSCLFMIINGAGVGRYVWSSETRESCIPDEQDWDTVATIRKALTLNTQASGCTLSGKYWFASSACLGLQEQGCVLGILQQGTGSGCERSNLNLLVRSLVTHLQGYVSLEDSRIKARFDERIIRSLSSGFVVLAPQDTTILHINPAGARILGGTVDGFIGQRLDTVLTSKLRVLDVIRTGKPILDEEMIITLRDRSIRIIKTAVPVFDDDGTIVAILDSFQEIKDVHKLVNRMASSQIRYHFEDILHSSPAMAEALEMGRIASESSLSVLITGESGTGKELFAQAIHAASSRRNGPFIVIDCASMPRDLVESELFGYTEGTFTGSLKGGRPGKFELADGGTVFLDELGELPIELQSRLLRVLQSHLVTRLGGREAIPVDIRVIAATNRNLLEKIKNKSFRDDLYYRLNVLSIHVPPLRARQEDIILLAKYFLQKYQSKMGRNPLHFTPAALEAMIRAPWHGNVRELENSIARAVQVCAESVRVEDIFPEVERKDICWSLEGRLPLDRIYDFPPYSQKYTVLPAEFSEPAQPRMKAVESDIYLSELHKNKGNIAKTARSLGVARSTVYKKVRSLGFDLDRLCQKLRNQ